MNVQVDKSRSEIIAIQVNIFRSVTLTLRSKRSDLAFAHDQLQTLSNSIRENTARVSEDYFHRTKL
jgi:hypothetical protein